ncbi:hypothetical protein KCU95_g2, partial [Aureobasidium melanogenum]
LAVCPPDARRHHPTVLQNRTRETDRSTESSAPSKMLASLMSVCAMLHSLCSRSRASSTLSQSAGCTRQRCDPLGPWTLKESRCSRTAVRPGCSVSECDLMDSDWTQRHAYRPTSRREMELTSDLGRAKRWRYLRNRAFLQFDIDREVSLQYGQDKSETWRNRGVSPLRSQRLRKWRQSPRSERLMEDDRAGTGAAIHTDCVDVDETSTDVDEVASYTTRHGRSFHHRNANARCGMYWISLSTMSTWTSVVAACLTMPSTSVRGARFSFLQKHATVRRKSLPTAPALPTVSGVSRAGGLASTHLSEEIDEYTGRDSEEQSINATIMTPCLDMQGTSTFLGTVTYSHHSYCSVGSCGQHCAMRCRYRLSLLCEIDCSSTPRVRAALRLHTIVPAMHDPASTAGSHRSVVGG